MANKTAMTHLIEYLDPIHQSVIDMASKLIELEKRQMLDAMMHALDEDGHTGEWKIKFVNDYYDKAFSNKK